MRIIRIKAGLGNQMFQYAFYKAILKKYGSAKIDLDAFNIQNFHHGYELEKIFGIQSLICSDRERKQLSNLGSDVISKIKLKLFGRKSSEYVEKQFNYSDEVFHLGEKNVYFDGNWQSEKYFMNIKDEVRKTFTFRNKLNEKNQRTSDYIKSSNSVSLHVRRGNYLRKPLFWGGCNIEYYNKAINIIIERVENPIFFIFSDDMDWCRKNIKIKGHEITYVSWNRGDESYVDMQLMSSCKHNIMANSSFSWWSAWLNDNKNKIVIAPEKWFNSEEINCSDLIPETWLKI